MQRFGHAHSDYLRQYHSEGQPLGKIVDEAQPDYGYGLAVLHEYCVSD